jgi:hypothetical protein
MLGSRARRFCHLVASRQMRARSVYASSALEQDTLVSNETVTWKYVGKWMPRGRLELIHTEFGRCPAQYSSMANLS